MTVSGDLIYFFFLSCLSYNKIKKKGVCFCPTVYVAKIVFVQF